MVDEPEGMKPIENPDGTVSYKCPVQVQRETPSGLVDSLCKQTVEKGQAGLCR